MRWVLTGVVAGWIGLANIGSAQACGGYCGGVGPGVPPAAYRYWSSAYGCYLYYDPAACCSYALPAANGFSPVPDRPPNMPAMPGKAPARADNAAAYGGQKTCPVTGAALGSMGPPIPVTVQGQTIYVCCPACVAKVQRDPDAYLRKVEVERAGG